MTTLLGGGGGGLICPTLSLNTLGMSGMSNNNFNDQLSIENAVIMFNQLQPSTQQALL
jgi:hypothetical protein